MAVHDILMITYNREDYTRMALTRLLETCDESMRVWVWHNGDHQGTLDVVRGLSGHPRFHRLHHSKENKRLREPTNWFWTESDGDYVSKIDDDCLEEDGWGLKLRSALEANPKLGVIGCWRFYDEDYVPELAGKKIRPLNGGSRLMENCWVQGSGYVMRRACIDQLGILRENESFPAYCIRAALAGWQNGWYFPFLHEEHMDDPRSPLCAIKTDEEFMAQRPLSAINDNVTTLGEWAARVKYMARAVQEASTDPRNYTGWRKRLRGACRRAKKLVGLGEEWRKR
jgi:glycosyltransferase involved in cell wall biosynthesis